MSAPALSAGGAEVCSDFAAVHYHVSGRHFRQPGGEGDYRQPEAFPLERWQLGDESAQGVRLARAAGAAGKRYAHGQLVALRPGDAKAFMLGQVRWLAASAEGALQVGVKLLPGIPAGIAARPTGLNAQNEPYVPALAAPASLVLPAGWFKPKRVAELFTDAPLRVRFTEVLERGADFERIVYESA
ncbi:MAG: hypothetical protein ACT4P3_07755 [Betaproteobacteria bacterium]